MDEARLLIPCRSEAKEVTKGGEREGRGESDTPTLAPHRFSLFTRAERLLFPSQNEIKFVDRLETRRFLGNEVEMVVCLFLSGHCFSIDCHRCNRAASFPSPSRETLL